MGYELPYYFNNPYLNLSWYYNTVQMEVVYVTYFDFNKNIFYDCVKCESLETKVKKYFLSDGCITYLNLNKISKFDILFY